MTNKDEIMLEEILTGFLRSSNKIKLQDMQKTEGNEDADTYLITFKVKKDFGSTLVNSLNNQFFEFFKKNGTSLPQN
jgi:hypothetical protein